MALKPVSVKQLNSYIKNVLKSDPILCNVSVTGEVSGLKLHGSGHVYFNLKDDESRINCFLPASVFELLDFDLADGKKVTAAGYVNVYERGGSYSLNIRGIRVEGIGDLAIAFEKLKDKLKEEGLFDPQVKKDLPAFPQKIAVVTSETGAAVQDILKIIRSRNNYTDVLIYPTLVQGERASKEISSAIDSINRMYPETDLMIVGRGGGSAEELWAFNEENVARAIFSSNIPVISAVGHETDFTIADFVADRRAETPTAAAHIAVPDIDELKFYLDELGGSVVGRFEDKIEGLRHKVRDNNMDAMANMLRYRLEQDRSKIKFTLRTMSTDISEELWKKHHLFGRYLKELEALNPKTIMSRGYSVLTGEDGRLVTSVKDLKPGHRVRAALIDGNAQLHVKSTDFTPDN